MEALAFYLRLVHSLRGDLLVCAALLFFGGLLCSPLVVEKQIRPLLVYPRWLWRRIQGWVHPGTPFLKMVALIFLLNAASLLVNIVSGMSGVLPFLFGFLIGLNVGVIVVEETGTWSLLGLVLNPVALLEFPATWISLSEGMELGLSVLGRFSFSGSLAVLDKGLTVYLALILPLLLVAAFTEVALIKWGARVGGKGRGTGPSGGTGVLRGP
ncbi:MAG: stage II sporulation protein M [Deltaproteobacteria bacterium]|nr:stage II sporulation protein M [Deltaproteobacteria bacterium]